MGNWSQAGVSACVLENYKRKLVYFAQKLRTCREVSHHILAVPLFPFPILFHPRCSPFHLFIHSPPPRYSCESSFCVHGFHQYNSAWVKKKEVKSPVWYVWIIQEKTPNATYFLLLPSARTSYTCFHLKASTDKQWKRKAGRVKKNKFQDQSQLGKDGGLPEIKEKNGEDKEL